MISCFKTDHESFQISRKHDIYLNTHQWSLQAHIERLEQEYETVFSSHSPGRLIFHYKCAEKGGSYVKYPTFLGGFTDAVKAADPAAATAAASASLVAFIPSKIPAKDAYLGPSAGQRRSGQRYKF